MLRIGLLSATVCAGIALLPVALSGQQVPVGALLSINVSPSAPTRSVGQQAILSANGIFTGGVRQLGGGGNMPRWSFILSPSMTVAVCAAPPASPSFGGQVIGIRDDGTFQETWSPLTPIVSASGTWTPANVHVDLKCVDQTISTITGVMDVAWTGTQYDGTFSFANSGVAELAGITWTSADQSVATVDQKGRVTAVAPGTTTITATYGRTCWPGEPQPAGGCRGTVAGTALMTVTPAACPPPAITSVSVSPGQLWPPNHKMVNMTVDPEVSSTCTQPVSCRIASITSSEPGNGLGDGDTAPDWNITGDLTAQLRAERAGDGGGRAYTIVTACSNSSGTAWHASVVTVPQYR